MKDNKVESAMELHGEKFTIIERFEGDQTFLDCLRELLEYYANNPKVA